MNTNIITWIFLIALSLISYFSSASDLGRASVFALMAVAILKCLLVGFQYMELRHAHLAWKLAFVSLIGLFTTFVGIMA